MVNQMDEKQLLNLDNKTLVAYILSQRSSLAQMSQQIDVLSQQVSMLTQERFGRKSDKNLSDITGEGYEQLSFVFNEAEITIGSLKPEEIPETTIEEITYKRKKKQKGKRDQDLSGIPEHNYYHNLSEDTLKEEFGEGGWKILRYETYKRLAFYPATFEVEVHHLPVYAAKNGSVIRNTPHPAGDLLRNSIVTPSLLAGILNYKYVNAQPLARLEKEFDRMSVPIARQNMCSWVIRCTKKYFDPLYARMKKYFQSLAIGHADETTVVVNKDDRPAGAKSYMWVYTTEPGNGDHPVILYDYQKGRSGEYPSEFLKDFHGILVTDGYQVYHTLENMRNDLTIAGCWAHAYRKVADIVKALGKEEAKGTLAQFGVNQISLIFSFDRKYKDLPPHERLTQRKMYIAPLVDVFFSWAKTNLGTQKALPKSPTGKALQYFINQEKYLRVFLTDGRVPLDNSMAERSIRPFVTGRKNWQVIDTIRGAEASATVYSIAETAKANQLKPREYFEYLLKELPKRINQPVDQKDPKKQELFLDDLLPWSKSLPETCRKAAPPKTEA